MAAGDSLGQVGSAVTGSGGSRALTVAYTAAVTAGNTVVLEISGAVIGGNTSTPTASDSRGNSFTLDAGPVVNGTSIQSMKMSCVLTTGVTTSDTISVAFDNSTQKVAAVVDAFSGAGIKDAAGTGTGSNAAPSATTTASTTQATEVAHAGYATAQVTYTSVGSGYSAGSTAISSGTSPFKQIQTAFKALTATGVQTATAAASATGTWSATVVAYKFAAGNPPTTGGLTIALALSGNAQKSAGALGAMSMGLSPGPSAHDVKSGRAAGTQTVLLAVVGQDQKSSTTAGTAQLAVNPRGTDIKAGSTAGALSNALGAAGTDAKQASTHGLPVLHIDTAGTDQKLGSTTGAMSASLALAMAVVSNAMGGTDGLTLLNLITAAAARKSGAINGQTLALLTLTGTRTGKTASTSGVTPVAVTLTGTVSAFSQASALGQMAMTLSLVGTARKRGASTSRTALGLAPSGSDAKAGRARGDIALAMGLGAHAFKQAGAEGEVILYTVVKGKARITETFPVVVNFKFSDPYLLDAFSAPYRDTPTDAPYTVPMSAGSAYF